MAPFQSSNDQNLFLMSKNCSKAMFEHERSIPSNFIYHNKYWFVTNKKLMIKTSFLDDRQELTLTDLFKTSRTSTMDFFCENSQQLLAVNQFRKKKEKQKTLSDIFDWVLNTHLAYLTSKRFADLSLRNSINLPPNFLKKAIFQSF